MNAPKKLSLRLKSEAIAIEVSEGIEKIFTLKELTGTQRDTYLEDIRNRVTLDDAGKVKGFKSLRGMQTLLISLTLTDENRQPITAKILDEWPASVLTALFEASQALSGLETEKIVNPDGTTKPAPSEEAAKNGSPASA